MHSPNRCTKGPWAIESCGTGEPDSVHKDSNGATYQPTNRVYARRTDGTQNGVAHIYCGTGAAIPKSDGRPGGMQKYLPTPAAIAEQTANAHLIAAAPELYEALIVVRSILGITPSGGDFSPLGSAISLHDTVINALKKADGPMDYSGLRVGARVRVQDEDITGTIVSGGPKEWRVLDDDRATWVDELQGDDGTLIFRSEDLVVLKEAEDE